MVMKLTLIFDKDFIEVVPIYKYKKIYKWKFVNFINSFFYKKGLKTIHLKILKLIIKPTFRMLDSNTN